MSILSRDGFFLTWMVASPYLSREACPLDGTDHRDCGLTWTAIPGVPEGRIEIRPARPHRQDGGWEYQIIAPPSEVIVGTGLTGLVGTQHAMLWRVPHVVKALPWVRAEIAVAGDFSWTATLSFNGKKKVLSWSAEDADRAVLHATRALLMALKKPVKLAISEPTGRLRALYDEGFWPGCGELGTLMDEVEKLSTDHIVRVLKHEKAEAPAATAGASNRTMS